MPYTPGQKAYILKQSGYDPSKYDFDEEGNVIPLDTTPEQPAAQLPTSTPTQETPSIAATAARSATESALPTAGALAASLGAAALTGGASLPVQLIAGLIAGTAGGIGTSKLQEAIVPDAIKEAVFTRPEDALNPWTRAGAGLLPMLITHSPVKGVGELGALLSRVPNAVKNPAFLSKAFTDADRQVALNTAVGVGAGTGINAGMQLANGGEISVPELAAAAAGGALFNSPRNTKFNRAVGLQPNPESTPITIPKLAVPDTWSPPGPLPTINRGVQDPVYVAEALRAQKAISDAALARQQAFEASRANATNLQQPVELPGNTPEYLTDQPILPFTANEAALQRQLEAIKRASALGELPKAPTQKAEKTVGATTMSPEEVAFKTKRLEYEGNKPKPAPTEAESPVLSPQEYEIKVDSYINKSPYAFNKEAADAMRRVLTSEANALESPQLKLIAEQQAKVALDKHLAEQETQRIRTEAESATTPAPTPTTLLKTGQVEETTRQPVPPFAKEVASNRGVNVADEATLPKNVQGLNYQPNRQVRLNPKNSNTATLGHEVIHQFVSDLRGSTDPKDTSFIARAEELAKRAGMSTPQEIEEFIANASDKDFARRIQLKLTGSMKQKFKSWLSDLKDALDYYRGSNDPATRLLTLRTLTDAPFGTRKEIVNEQRIPTVQRPSSVQGLPSSMRTDQRSSTSEESGSASKAIGGNAKESNGGESTVGGGNSPPRGSTSIESSARSASDYNSRSKPSTSSEGNGGKQKESGSNPSGAEAGSSSAKKLSNTETTKFSQGEVGDTSSTPPIVEERKRFSIPGIRSQLDALKSKIQELGPKGSTALKALEDFAQKHTEHAGKYKDALMYELRDKLGIKMRPSNIKNWLEGDSPTARRVLEHLDNLSDNKPGLDLTPKEEEVVQELRDMFVKIREDQNSREGLREGGVDPDYFPQTISREAINVIKNKPNTKEALAYKKDYVEYVSEKITEKSKGKITKEKAIEQAEVLYSNLLKGFSQENVNLAKSFGPIDKAVGYGVPPSMREKNLVRRLNNYLERTALRFAHYDSIEASPEVNDALFGKEGIITNDSIRSIYHRMGGIRPPTEQIVEGVTGIIKAAVTGTAAGIRDVVTTPFLGAQHQDFFQVPKSSIKSALDISKNWKESFEQGINRVHIGSLESGDTNSGWPGGLNVLHRLRDVGNEVQFRNWLEQLSRTWAYSNGKVLATENLIAASNGKASRQQQKFLDDFGPADWAQDPTKLYDNPEAIKSIATRYAESIAGTYDSRGLPSWALEGPLAPMLSLNRWSIEKTNNFVKYALDPIKEGNFKPFLNQTAWLMLGGGAAIEALNELLSNKKSKLPSVKELETTKDLGGNWKGGTIYKAVGLAALSGYMGEITNLTKLMADAHYKNSDRWYNLMVVEFAHRTASYVPHFVEALAQNDIDLALDIANDYLSEYSQTWRILSHQISKERKDELLSQDENRDVKIFKQLMGKDLGEIPTDVVKDYSKEHQRKFHKARTFEDTIDKLPEARQEAMRDVKTAEDYKSAMRGLGAASYGGYPSIENSPIEAAQFGNFLRASQGDTKANARLQESLRMRELNKAKRQFAR